MRTERKGSLLLQDIYSASSMLEKFTAEMEEHEFIVHDMVRHACSWNLIVIGEAVRRLPDSIKTKYHHIPWSDIVMNRNYLAHNYESVSWKIVWLTIIKDAIPLRHEINSILQEEYSVDISDL